MNTICVYVKTSPEDTYGSEFIDFPIADRKLAGFLTQIGHDPDDTRVYAAAIIPREFECLCGQPLDLKEINNLAKRICNMKIRDQFTYRAALEAYEPETIEDATDILLHTDRYILIQYGKSLPEMGHDYLMALNGRIEPEDDIGVIGIKLIAEGNGIQTAYGYLFRKDEPISGESDDSIAGNT